MRTAPRSNVLPAPTSPRAEIVFWPLPGLKQDRFSLEKVASSFPHDGHDQVFRVEQTPVPLSILQVLSCRQWHETCSFRSREVP
jgi:hypothetical protein